MFCENCGAQIGINSKFCSACGTSVARESDAEGKKRDGIVVNRDENSTVEINTNFPIRLKIFTILFIAVFITAGVLCWFLGQKFVDLKQRQTLFYTNSNLNCLEETAKTIPKEAEQFKQNAQQLILDYQTTDISEIDKTIVPNEKLSELESSRNKMKDSVDSMMEAFAQSGLDVQGFIAGTEDDVYQKCSDFSEKMQLWREDLIHFKQTVRTYDAQSASDYLAPNAKRVVIQAQKDSNSENAYIMNNSLNALENSTTELESHITALRTYINKEQKQANMYFTVIIVVLGLALISLLGIIICAYKYRKFKAVMHM